MKFFFQKTLDRTNNRLYNIQYGIAIAAILYYIK